MTAIAEPSVSKEDEEKQKKLLKEYLAAKNKLVQFSLPKVEVQDYRKSASGETADKEIQAQAIPTGSLQQGTYPGAMTYEDNPIVSGSSLGYNKYPNVEQSMEADPRAAPTGAMTYTNVAGTSLLPTETGVSGIVNPPSSTYTPTATPAASTPAAKTVPVESLPQAQGGPQILGMGLGGGGGGGWARTMSKPALEEMEQGLREEGMASLGGIDRSIEAAQKAEAIRRAARDDASAQTADMIGRQEGQYFTAVNELKRAQSIKEDADLEAEKAMNEVRESKIDPGKFFHERDTATNVGLALSVAMGSFWSAFTGQNPALDILQKAIDRDLRSQEVNLANKRAVMDTALRRNLQKTGELDRAKELTRLQMIEVVRMQAGKMAMDNQSAGEAANYENMMAALDNMKDKAMADITLAHADFRAKTEARTGGGGGQLVMLKQGQENYKKFVPGIGLVPDEAEASKLRDQTSDIAETQRELNEAAQLLGQFSLAQKKFQEHTPFSKSSEYIEFQAHIQNARFALSNAVKQGVIREQEAANFDQMIGDPSSWQDSDVLQKAVGNIAFGLNRKMESIKKQHNGIDAHIAQMYDPNSGVLYTIALPHPMVNPGQSAFNRPANPGLQLKPLTSGQ